MWTQDAQNIVWTWSKRWQYNAALPLEYVRPATRSLYTAYQILAKPDNPRVSYDDLSIFYTAADRHLDFDQKWILTILEASGN